LLEGESLQPGAGVTDAAGNNLGPIVSAAGEGRIALAVLQAARAADGLHSGEAPARELPLAGGLQRPA
jgi:hypothetical protein